MKKINLSLFSLAVFVFLGLGVFSNNAEASNFSGNGTTASANAGPDQTITLPTNYAGLSGSSTGVDGIVLYYSWTKLSGSGNISSPSSASTQVTNLTLGTSTFRLTVTNNTGTTVTDDVNIFVEQVLNPHDGVVPSVDAGTDKVIYLPNNSGELSGSAVAYNASIVSYSWTKISGSGNISSPTQKTTMITGLSLGTSVFRLSATDSMGLSGYDDVNIYVQNNNGGSYDVCPTGTIGTYPNCVAISGGAGGSGGGGSGSSGCMAGYVGVYPNCVLIDSGNTIKINIPAAGVKRTSSRDAVPG